MRLSPPDPPLRFSNPLCVTVPAPTVFCAVVVAAYPHLLRGPDHDDHPSTRDEGSAGPGAMTYLTLLALVGIAVANYIGVAVAYYLKP